MPSPKNWKKAITKLIFFLAFFILSGCTLQGRNVRPSFDENYIREIHVSGRIRPSFNREQVRQNQAANVSVQEDTLVLQEIVAVAEQTAVFEVRHRQPPPPQEENRETVQSPRQGRIRRAAERYLGVPYLFGGSTRNGFDCSGFVWRVYQDLGHTDFARTNAQTMYDRGTRVARNNIRKGDLVFFVNPRNRNRINHVGIYLGDGTFIHSSSTRGVAINPLNDIYWGKYLSGFRRFLPN
jgi:cell wall-associated NlpC family hydrolase